MLSIESLSPDDLPQTAALHKSNLRLGLFPRLGRSFLRRYQETFAASPYGIALVAKSGERVVGALFGTTSNPDHYRWVVHNCGWDLALAGGGALLLRPHLAWTFASTRVGRYMRGLRRHIAPAPATAGPVAPSSVLSHIVTAETERRRGIGRRLVEEFKVLARRHGARRATLITEEGGDGVPFFERMGCACVTHRQGRDGSVVREYRLPLDEAETHEGMGYDHRRRNCARPRQRSVGAAGTLRPAGHMG